MGVVTDGDGFVNVVFDECRFVGVILGECQKKKQPTV